jgi:glycolate oxidase iron-sulfur subunit
VQYGHLVDIGRKVVDSKVERPLLERLTRTALKQGLTSPLFTPAMKIGQMMRPLMPAALKSKVPARGGARAQHWPTRAHSRRVLMLLGCVQPAMMPNVNAATARVLDAAGIQTLVADGAGCCGAIRTHLGDVEGGLDDMRRNIDAWWPLVEGLTRTGDIEAIVMNASGCGVTVKDYGHALAHDSLYAGKAERISALTKDLSELLPDIVAALRPNAERKEPAKESLPGRGVHLAYHPPCTLQHGQQLRGGVETHLRELGFEVSLAGNESHLCCGSAGTYSVLQAKLAYELRDRKLEHLAPLNAKAIVSANIGCIQHLQSGTTTPVRHWVEVLDAALVL